MLSERTAAEVIDELDLDRLGACPMCLFDLAWTLREGRRPTHGLVNRTADWVFLEIEESLKSLEDEFADRFVRIHRNCLVARQELVELRRGTDGHVMAMLRSGGAPLEVSRRCVPQLRQTLRHL